MTDEIEAQLNGAKYIYFGILQGIASKVKINIPKYVYHYTSWDSFCSMTNSNSLRMHTVKNFDDKEERAIQLPIDNRIEYTITDDDSNSAVGCNKRQRIAP